MLSMPTLLFIWFSNHILTSPLYTNFVVRAINDKRIYRRSWKLISPRLPN
jgi:hypothetical protein